MFEVGSTLDLELLRTFQVVAQSGSLAATAEVRHRTLSAISMQMKRLETELDVRLLERGPRGVTLTASGELLLREAQALLRAHDTLVSRFSRERLSGACVWASPRTMRVSCSTTPCRSSWRATRASCSMSPPTPAVGWHGDCGRGVWIWRWCSTTPPGWRAARRCGTPRRCGRGRPRARCTRRRSCRWRCIRRSALIASWRPMPSMRRSGRGGGDLHQHQHSRGGEGDRDWHGDRGARPRTGDRRHARAG